MLACVCLSSVWAQGLSLQKSHTEVEEEFVDGSQPRAHWNHWELVSSSSAKLGCQWCRVGPENGSFSHAVCDSDVQPG